MSQNAILRTVIGVSMGVFYPFSVTLNEKNGAGERFLGTIIGKSYVKHTHFSSKEEKLYETWEKTSELHPRGPHDHVERYRQLHRFCGCRNQGRS